MAPRAPRRGSDHDRPHGVRHFSGWMLRFARHSVGDQSVPTRPVRPCRDAVVAAVRGARGGLRAEGRASRRRARWRRDRRRGRGISNSCQLFDQVASRAERLAAGRGRAARAGGDAASQGAGRGHHSRGVVRVCAAQRKWAPVEMCDVTRSCGHPRAGGSFRFPRFSRSVTRGRQKKTAVFCGGSVIRGDFQPVRTWEGYGVLP
jgi:hypothetical protein